MSQFLSPLGNRRGIALLFLVLVFTLLGVLASFGVSRLGSLVTRGKVNDTKAGLEREVQQITAWAVRNGRLPATAPSDEYAALFGVRPLDAWSRPVLYAYDGNLTATSGGGLCGRTGTAISSGGGDVAFVLISGGDDASITSTPNQNGPFSGPLAGLQGADLYRIVTLKELQAGVDCSGSTGGALRIVNNELPGVCKGIPYSVTLFGDGGVPPVSFTFSSLPAGLSSSGAALSGTTTAAQGPYPVVVTATDSQLPTAHAVQRNLVLNIMSSCRSH